MKKAILHTIGALALCGGAVYGATDYLARTAMDREQPKSLVWAMGLLEGRKKGEDPYAGLTESWERLRSAPHERVELRAHDGVRLVGHWFPVPEARRVILAVHGWRSRWYRDFGAVADFWQENGCSVLYIEQRGQGGSEGDYIGFGLLERDDIPDWLGWLRERCGGQVPTYLAGISMGATTVLMAADLDLPENVRGIMADCGFTSPDGIWRHVARDNLHLPYVLSGWMADRLCRRKLGLSAKARSTTEALRRCRVPVLFFHGEADSFVPVEMTWENYAACAAPKRILTVPGAVHGMSYLLDREGYEAAELQFFADYDQAPASPQ